MVVSRPTPGSTQSSPPRIIMCSAGCGLSSAGCTASSRAQLTGLPILIARAASSRFAGVIRLSAPDSSSLPQRPQFLTDSNTLRMYAGVHFVAVAVAMAPPPVFVGESGNGAVDRAQVTSPTAVDFSETDPIDATPAATLRARRRERIVSPMTAAKVDIQIEPLHADFGACIRGVDLRVPVDALAAQLHDWIDEYSL